MLFTFIKSSIRLLAKDKFSNFLNILGLSIGIASFFLLISYVKYELSYDRFHSNYKNIYRLQINWNEENKENKWAFTAPGIGNALKQDYSEIQSIVRILPSSDYLTITRNDIKFRSEKILYTDSSFFTVFSFKLLKGSPKDALREPNTVVITESTAKKIFGNEDPIDKTLTFYDKRGEFITTIKGVVQDAPENSHIKFDYLVSYNIQSQLRGSWFETSLQFLRTYTYLLLKPGTNPKVLESKFPAFLSKHNLNDLSKPKFLLQPIKDIHLFSNLEWDTKNGNAIVVYALLLSSILVILLAWINFINISITKSIDRVKEIAIRNILGSSRIYIVFHVLVDSFIQNIIAIIIAFIWFFIFQEVFISIIGFNVAASLGLMFIVLFILTFLIISTLFLGIYPAVVLSNYKLAVIVKGKISTSPKGLLFRRYLTVFQFFVAIVILTTSLAITGQINFMMNFDKGINTNDILILRAPVVGSSSSDYAVRIHTLKKELLKYPEIKSVSSNMRIPGDEVPIEVVKRLENLNQNGYNLAIINVDNDYISTYGLKLVAGQNFSDNPLKEKYNVLINETALKLMGYSNPDNAINSKLRIDTTYTIIGIIKDFHQESLKKAKIPILFQFEEANKVYYSVKYNSADLNKTINILKTNWENLFPIDAFDYFLLKETLDEQYKVDIRFRKMFFMFTFLSLIISGFGVFGLSYFTSVSRTKEVAIRKVLGSSKWSIQRLFVSNYVKLIIISSIIGIPVTVYVINRILENYVYRVTLTIFTFIIPVLIILLITLLTTYYHTHKVTSTLPSKSLKSE